MPHTIYSKHSVTRFLAALRWLALGIVLACLFLVWTTSTVQAQSCTTYPSPHLRMGYNFTRDGNVKITDYDFGRLGAGWYHDYTFHQTPDQPGGLRYHQMVRGLGYTTTAQIQQLLTSLGPVVDANPGALWILGNEPDRHGQDELTPAQYARFYHDLYTFIKQRDPTSHTAIAGVVQPTPIRLRYLDMVLAAYQQSYGTAMPVEYWDVHNFILPENCDWGAGIPPGLEAYQTEGIACPATLDDHGNLTIFKQQLRTFRQWMTKRGYQNRPLIVSEYGILLSPYHGYDYPRVRDFMLGTFTFMLNTTDSATGYPQDGNRLVQEFAWFSLNYYAFNLETYTGLNGNLFDHDSRQITPLGLDYANYVKSVTKTAFDLSLTTLQATPATVNVRTPVLLTATFTNQGTTAAKNVTVRFWNGNPLTTGQLLGTAPVIPEVGAQCTSTQATFTWTPPQTGVYTIFADLQASNLVSDSTPANNYANVTLNVSTALTATPTTVTATPTATAATSTTPTATPTATASTSTTPTTTPTATASTSTTPTATPTVTASTPLTPTATSTALVLPEATLTPTASPQPLPSATLSATVSAPTGTPAIGPTPTATLTTRATPDGTATPTASTPLAASFTFTLTVTPANPTVGDDLLYTIHYSNDGEVALTDLTFRLIIPADTQFNSSKSDPDWRCLQASAGNPCQLVLATVASKSQGTIHFALTLQSHATQTIGTVHLTVVASNAAQSISLERSAEVAVREEQRYMTYLPVIKD